MYDVFLDFSCPWCFVAHHHIQQSLAKNPQKARQVCYRAFQLNPHLPCEGIARIDYRINKFGSLAESIRRDQAVMQHVQTLGLPIDFSRILKTPNTRAVHRMIQHAKKQGTNLFSLYESIFTAYFVEGKDIGDLAIIVQIAMQHNIAITKQDIEKTYATEHHKVIEKNIDTDIAFAQEHGIYGVPFFLKHIDQRVDITHLHNIMADITNNDLPHATSLKT